MPGRHITDHQVRLYMDSREEHRPAGSGREGRVQQGDRIPHRVRSSTAVAEAPAARSAPA